MKQSTIYLIASIFVVLALIPLALVAKSWYAKSTDTRFHPVKGMDNQPRDRTQQASELFLDGRTSRPIVDGSVPRGDGYRLMSDTELYDGKTYEADGVTLASYVDRVPEAAVEAFASPRAMLQRGELQYNRFCSQCHGLNGQGMGPITVRAQTKLLTWTPPANLTDPIFLPVEGGKEDGYIYEVIRYGKGQMSGYASSIHRVEDRWAIVAWVRTLQLAYWTDLDQVPPSAPYREDLERAIAEANAPEGGPDGASAPDESASESNAADPSGEAGVDAAPESTTPEAAEPSAEVVGRPSAPVSSEAAE